MNIGIILLDFHGIGGMQRIAANLLNGLSQRGHHLSLFYCPNKNKPIKYLTDDSIRLIKLLFDFQDGIFDFENTHKLIRNENLDVLCFMNSSNQGRIFPCLLNNLGIPSIYSEHSNPNIIETQRWDHYERLACMSCFDSIHILCKSYILSIPSYLKSRTVIIPNFTDFDITKKYINNNIYKCIIVAGRLEERVKQFSILLKALKILRNKFPDWRCHICGDGNQYNYYIDMINKLGLQGYVNLLGVVDDMPSEYMNAGIFAIPSRYEGFPLSLIEAQAFGVPSVGFADCSGVNEIIIHGENGLLAPEMTPESLADTLRILMSDTSLRQRMGAQARTLSARYDREHILDQWESLFHRTVTISRSFTKDSIDSIPDAIIKKTIYKLIDSPIPSRIEYTFDLLRKRILQTNKHSANSLNEVTKNAY